MLNEIALEALRRLVQDGQYPDDATARVLLAAGVVDLVGGTELRPNDLAAELLED